MNQSDSYMFHPVSSSSGKPSLSKPRLFKSRKNAAHGKPTAAVQEPDRSSDFNPFRPEKIEEKIGRWKPFVPEPGAGVSESPSANGSAFGFGGANPDAVPFVFGSSGPGLSRNSSGRSAASFYSAQSEGPPFMFGSGMEKNNDLSRASSLGSDESLVFSKFTDEMRKLDLKNPGNGDDFERKTQDENAFGFGGRNVNKISGLDSGSAEFLSGSLSGSKPMNVGSEKPSMHSFGFGSCGSGNSDAAVSILGNGMKKGVDVMQNSSLGLEEGPFSKLPDGMRKLNLKNTGNVNDFEKNKQAENVFPGGSKTGSGLSFGSNLKSAEFLSGPLSGSKPMNVGSEKPSMHSFSFGSCGSGNSDAGVSIVGNGMKKGVDVMQNSSLGLEEGPFSKLPDEMRKLNLKNTGNVNDFEKNKQAETVIPGGSKTGSGLSFGSNLKSAEFVSVAGSVSSSKPINIGFEKPTVGSFNFGSGVKKSVDLSRNSSLGSDDGLFSKLPDEMRKMNLSSGDDFQKTKRADFVSGSNKDVTDSFGSGIANKVPLETGKLNVGKETGTESMKNESADSLAGVFTFRSCSGKSSFLSFDYGMASDLPVDQKLSNKGLEKGKEMGCNEKVDGNVFESGASVNASASFGGSAVNTVHDDVEKLKIGTNTEDLAGRVPFEVNFQSGKEDHRSNMGYIPSSPAPGFQSPRPMFSFTSMPVGLETPQMEFKTPKQDAARLTKETLFAGTYQNTAFSAKRADAKSTKMKKKRGKSRQTAPVYQKTRMQFVSQESGPHVNPEVDSTGGYSPMDYSPYHEDIVAEQYSREPSVASEDSICFVSRGGSTDTQRSISGDEREEVLVSAAQRLNISEDNLCKGDNGGSKDNVMRTPNAESAFTDEHTNKFGNGNEFSKHETVGLDNDSRTAPMEAEASFFISNTEKPASEVRTEFAFSSSLEDLGASSFAFTAPTFVRGPLSAVKHNHRRKNKQKSGQNPPGSTPNARVPLASSLPDLIPHIDISGLPDSVEGEQSTSTVPRSEDENRTGKSKEAETRQESTISFSASIAAQEACEKWRFRGNQAYSNGYLTKAEDYYTCGVNSVSLKEIPSNCIRPLTLCYSNRAATRMSLGKMRDALRDCKMAVSIDPSFLKARVRVANCHLALGEIGEALQHFRKCLQSETDSSSDKKYLVEASDGLKRAQLVADLTGQSAELLLKRKSNDASKALNMISEALSISPHSESLLEMKAEALLMIRNYEEVIKLCEQTLDLAEQNSAVIEADSQFKSVDSSEYMKSSPSRLWRWHLIAKSYFYLGKLEEALELLQKHENLKPAVDKSPESSTSFAVTIRELLRLKSAGNEAFQAGRLSEAVEYYSSALACNAESRPFTAVCFCNRAAAYQALGQITDAIADCSLAIALDPSYPKAISRRATLHEMIRDYGQAANDLNRLISLLEKQMVEKDNQSRGIGRSTANDTDLKRARSRLAAVEEEGRKGISLNMYMILGIEPSSSAADVKKAYRKAALRHHPDKAGQFLARNENIDDGVWREVFTEVHADADRLFKMIGEAYTLLSDPTKRMQYDDEEEMRTCPVKGYNVSSPSPRTSSDNYGGHYERSFNRRQWRANGSSYTRW